MKRAIFLDRDGVINRAYVSQGTPSPPRSLEEVEILPGVSEALNLFRAKDFELVVVTNQPDVARGESNIEFVESIHTHLRQVLGINHFFTCYHDDLDECDCRKPKPGLLQMAAQNLDLDLHKSFMVGDRWRDIAAGQSAGCRCFFIDHGYLEKSPKLPYVAVRSLIEASQLILENLNDNFP